MAGDRLLFGAGHRWPAEGPLVTARFAGRAVDDDDDYDDDDDDDDEVGGAPIGGSDSSRASPNRGAKENKTRCPK